MSDDPVLESELVPGEESPVSQALTLSERALLQSQGSGPLVPSALAAQMIAQVQARYVVAERRPRDLEQVKAALLRECSNRKFAQVARFKLPRGGKTIEGFSIRFAEAAAREYRNILVQDIVTHDDSERRIVKVCVTDLESNTYYDHDVTIKKTVERRNVREGQRALYSRVNTEGRTIHIVESTDEELDVKAAALTSKTIRNLVLRLLPMWLKDECEKKLAETIRGEVKENPKTAAEKIVAAFAAKKVTAEDLTAYLGHPLDAITEDETVELRGVYQALAEGEIEWREILLAKGTPPPPLAPEEAPPEGETPTSQRAREIKEVVRRNRASQPPPPPQQ